MKLFFPITKIDEEKRLVYGQLTSEEQDSSGETFDYETSKPYFKEWVGYFSKATDGKSCGNLRAMHDNKKAVGTLPQVELDDIAKTVNIVGHVVDDEEWKKCLAGVYTGFSQGGSYVRKWNDGSTVRFTAKPAEASLVDYPNLKSSTFQVVKADGIVEERPFTKIEKEPVLRKYLGDEVWDARRALECLDTLIWMWAHERDEGDTAQAADLKTVVDKLKSFIASEIMEDGEAEMAMAAKVKDLEKRADYCPNCKCEKCNDTRTKAAKINTPKEEDEMEKAQFDAIMTKLDDQGKLIVTVQAENADLKKRLETADAKIAELGKAPEPPAVAITDTGKTVTKVDDTGITKTEEVKDPLAMIKMAQTSPLPLKPGFMQEDLRKSQQ